MFKLSLLEIVLVLGLITATPSVAMPPPNKDATGFGLFSTIPLELTTQMLRFALFGLTAPVTYSSLMRLSREFRSFVPSLFNDNQALRDTVHGTIWQRSNASGNFLPVNLSRLTISAPLRRFAMMDFLRRANSILDRRPQLSDQELVLRLSRNQAAFSPVLVHTLPRYRARLLRLAAIVVDAMIWNLIKEEVRMLFGALPGTHAWSREWTEFGRSENQGLMVWDLISSQMPTDAWLDIADRYWDRVARELRAHLQNNIVPQVEARIRNFDFGQPDSEGVLGVAIRYVFSIYQTSSLIIRHSPEITQLIGELSIEFQFNGISERIAQQALDSLPVPPDEEIGELNTQFEIMRLAKSE